MSFWNISDVVLMGFSLRKSFKFAFDIRLNMSHWMLILILSASIPCSALAQQKKKEKPKLVAAPHFVTIGSDADTSALSMDCHGETPFNEISCSFDQLRVSKKSSKDVEEEKAQLQTQIRKVTESEIKKEFGTMCSNLSDEKTKSRLASLSAEKKAFVDTAMGDFSVACRCLEQSENKKECLAQAMSALTERRKGLCTVSNNSFELRFKRTGERKWISNPGPTGICDVVNVVTIEHEPDSANLWTFTQTRVTANTDSELCKGFEFNKPSIYSWRSGSESLLRCEAIKFGVF